MKDTIANRLSERSEESSCIGTAIINEIDSLYIIACGNDNVHDDGSGATSF